MDKTMIYLFVGNTIEEPGPASLEPDTLLGRWHTGLPQPWAHIQQHLNGGDVHTRARGHRHVLGAHQALTHTLTATTPSPPPHHSADAQDPASDSDLAGSRTRRPLARTSGIQRTPQRRSKQ